MRIRPVRILVPVLVIVAVAYALRGYVAVLVFRAGEPPKDARGLVLGDLGDHALTVVARDLEPGRPHWYQFLAGRRPVRSAGPAPRRHATPDRIASGSRSPPASITSKGSTAHAAFPWIVTWDDHEVDNNYAGAISERGDPVGAFLRRRASAYQAYYEHLPLRRGSLPRGPDLPLFRRLAFDELADFHVLDGRQYRSDQACGDGVKARCPEAEAPERTTLGAAQEAWLQAGLDRSRARWNVLANQTLIAQLDSAAGEERQVSMDNWNGYPAARRRLLEFLARRRPANPVVITGDIHSNWVADLKTNFDDGRSPTVAAEFVGTSISSGGDGADMTALGERGLAENPHIKFFNGQRGYVRCEVTPEQWRADYQVVEFVTQPHAPIKTRAGFVIENGRPRVVPA